MKKALLVIDVQNYFMNSLTKYLPQKILRYIEQNRANFDLIIFTNFVNTPKSSVYRFLGWKKSITSPEIDIVPELQPALKYGTLISKGVLSALKVPKVKTLLKKNKIKKLYLSGIDTDCCVLATAYYAFDQGYRVYLFKNLSMSHASKNLHEAAVSMFKRNVGLLTKT